jgi:serine/threonine protein kinase/predicted Zn-dependent protease
VVGGDFLGFHLVGELGRGTFGRVYLAKQGDLADRPVALKVSTEIWAESQLLARLQHTHIVPIYSLHRSGRLQAVCMPYFGSTTLADVLDHLAVSGELPQSGKGLVSTLRDRQGKTRREVPAAPEGEPTEPSVSSPDVAATRATLHMLEELSYTDAVLWVIARLAEGLGHAHERGVLHRDLKPANVLLTDEGQPMLLDFNLAEYARGPDTGAGVGGTLPYMAPEHLAAFLGDAAAAGLPGGARPVDARSDLYSLGILLFELLTGKHPFTPLQGPTETVVPWLVNERLQPPPSARRWNPAVSPATDAIVRRCLAPDPARRYQSAADLQEDLDRQREHRPLRHASEPSLLERLGKWRRRHPALTSTASVAVSALLLLAAFTLSWIVWSIAVAKEKETRLEQIAALQAAEAYRTFRIAANDSRWLFHAIPEREPDHAGARDAVLRALDRYDVLRNDDWQTAPAVRRLSPEDQEQLRTEVGWLLLFLAEPTAFPDPSAAPPVGAGEAERWTRLAEKCFAPGREPQALWRQRSRLAELLDRAEEAEQMRHRAAAAPAVSARDRYLRGREARLAGDWRRAREELEAAVAADATDYASWQLLGNLYAEDLYVDQAAIDHFSVCIALQPNFYGGYLKRGMARLRHNEAAEAEADFTRVVELRPDLVAGWQFRARARLTMRKFREAEDDLTQALELPESSSFLYYLRSRVRRERGDATGADADLALGAIEPTDEDGFVARGLARATTDPRGALADFARALQCNPTSLAALQNSAYVLAERLGKNAEAVGKLDDLLGRHPGFVQALAGRAVLHARLGHRDAALRDARDALRADGSPATLYQLAGAYALTGKDHPEDRQDAYRLLYKAVQLGYGLNLLHEDPDLAPLRNEEEFKQLVVLVRTWQRLEPGNAAPRR